MSSTNRGRDVATALAALLVVVLALVWLRSSDAGPPTVPAGLSVETMPADAPEEPAPDVAAPLTRGIERQRAGSGRRAATEAPKHGERGRKQKGRDDDRARGWAGSDRQDPPATRPAPSVGSGGHVRSGGGRPAAPEFALE